MAKQHTLVPLTGKIGESSYYYTRNGGFQMRRINPNMSERVKTEPGFENTRKQAQEFGSAGSTAGALVRTMLDRWRYIITPRAAGDMTQVAYAGLKTDVVMPFGRRSLPQSAFSEYMAAFNRHIKNPLLPGVVTFMENNIKWDEENSKVTSQAPFTITTEMLTYMKRYGLSQIEFKVYNLTNVVSHFVQAMAGYTPGYGLISNSPVFSGTAEASESAGELIWPSMSIAMLPRPIQAQNECGGILVLMFPEKTINQVQYVQQRLCAARWIPIATI